MSGFSTRPFTPAFGTVGAPSFAVGTTGINVLSPGTTLQGVVAGVAIWAATAAGLAVDPAFTIANAANSASALFSYPTSGAGTNKELTITASANNLNVLVLQNNGATNSFSALAVRDSDGIERGAFGFGNSTAAAPFTSSVYIEASYYTGSSHTTVPAPLKFVQTGYLNGVYGTYLRQEFDTAGAINFYRPNGSTKTLQIGLSGNTFLFANATSDTGSVFSSRVDSTSSANVASASANSSVLRLEQLGNASTGVIYNPNALTYADGQLHLHLDHASSTSPNVSLRHDGTGSWLSLRNSAGTEISALTQSSGATLLTATGNISFQPTGLVGFGGLTSSFPALKRSLTVLQARLADDSGFAPLQGMLRTDTNATTGLTAGVLSALTNADIVMYDASGQAYRVPCII